MSLRTGNSYQVKFGSMGYHPAEYLLQTGPFESRTALQVSLRPEAGTIRLHSDTEGLRLLLNGSRYYRSGGQRPSYLALEPTSGYPQDLELSPGTYTLRVERPPTSPTR